MDGVTLVPTTRKPIDVLAEGLEISKSRGDSPFTFMNETPGLGLIHALIPQVITFQGDEILSLVRRGLYRNTRAIRKAREMA